MFASSLVGVLNGFVFNRNIRLTNNDNTNLDKENCKQSFDFSAKTKQSNKTDCSNNVTSNEKKIDRIRIFYLTSEWKIWIGYL